MAEVIQVQQTHCMSSKSMDELEAILSDDEEQHPLAGDESSSSSPPPIQSVVTTDSNFPHLGDLVLHSVSSYPEVLYEKSTPLFTAIEHTKWREAYQLAKEYPQQITTWVVSQSNSTNDPTTLSWSLWKRLPLHEVRDYLYRTKPTTIGGARERIFLPVIYIVLNGNVPFVRSFVLLDIHTGMSSSGPCLVGGTIDLGLSRIRSMHYSIW
jgi:hypothetical protein